MSVIVIKTWCNRHYFTSKEGVKSVLSSLDLWDEQVNTITEYKDGFSLDYQLQSWSDTPKDVTALYR